MDITGLQSVSLSTANTINDVSVQMLAKSLDSMEEAWRRHEKDA